MRVQFCNTPFLFGRTLLWCLEYNTRSPSCLHMLILLKLFNFFWCPLYWLIPFCQIDSKNHSWTWCCVEYSMQQLFDSNNEQQKFWKVDGLLYCLHSAFIWKRERSRGATWDFHSYSHLILIRNFIQCLHPTWHQVRAMEEGGRIAGCVPLGPILISMVKVDEPFQIFCNEHD